MFPTSNADLSPNAKLNANQPPTLHWAVVLLLSIVTFGLFYYVWAIRQAVFTKSIDASKARTAPLRLFVASTALMFFGLLMSIMNALTLMHGGEPANLAIVSKLTSSFEYLFLLLGTFTMRKTLTACYGIKMNAFLTWLLGIFYVQHHMTRIAQLHLPQINADSSTAAVPQLAQTPPQLG